MENKIIAVNNNLKLTPSKVWTKFMDMHSGGTTKIEPYQFIYINSNNENDAIRIFEEKFDQYPDDVFCECCGENFCIDTNENLYQITGYQRNCDCINNIYVENKRIYNYRPYIPLEEYIKRDDVLFLDENGEPFDFSKLIGE